MTKLLWDQAGSRVFETGIDHGVLYLQDTHGVPWNGLISVEEDFDDSSDPAYFDGVKYFDVPSTGDYSATLTAFTYPDEFLEFEGMIPLEGGLYVDDQNSKLFGLSYRTLVGNDVDNTEHGYKIHLVYNLTAIPDSRSYSSLSDSPNPLNFGWKITGIPVDAPGYRPTAHVIFDSRYLKADILAAIEDILYGKDTVDTGIILDSGAPDSVSSVSYDAGSPGASSLFEFDSGITTYAISVDARQPSLAELMDFVYLWGPMVIVPHTTTGLADLIPGIGGDLTATNVAGVFTPLPTTRLAKTSIEGLNHLT